MRDFVLDLGTTTLQYYDEQGELHSIQNAEYRFGLDVVSRLDYCRQYGADELNTAIWGQLDSITGKAVDRAVICGNTAMLSILMGVDTSPLCAAPFKISEHFGKVYNNIHGIHELYIPPCTSAFLGADVYAGVIGSGMLEYNTALLVDIGTNCEMVLKDGDRFIGCSVAAGPAFDRYGVYCSEYIDLLCRMKSEGVLSSGGFFKEPPNSAAASQNGTPLLTQDDIRDLILAKASVFSGIKTLLDLTRVRASALDTVIITGGITIGLNLISAVRVGLLPSELLNKINIKRGIVLDGCNTILSDKFNENALKSLNITPIQLAHLDLYKNYLINNAKI